MTDTNTVMSTDDFIRSQVTDCSGGAKFDVGGSYVFSEMLKAERELQKKAVEGDPSSTVLAFSVADPVWKMAESAMESGMKYYRENPDSTRYTDLAGIRDFELNGVTCADTNEALAALLGPVVGTQVEGFDSGWIQYSPGAIKKALSTYVPTAFFDENTVLIMPEPSYGVIADAKNRNGAEVVNVPLLEGDGRYDLDLIEIERIALDAQDQGKNVVLYANVPHNPTGFGYNAGQWEKLLEVTQVANVLVVVDEAYTHLAYDKEVVSVTSVPGWEKNCVVLQSISKAYNATGARFGWIIGHPTMIKVMRSCMDCKDSGSPGWVIASALYCLTKPHLADNTRLKYQQIHEQLSEALDSVGLNVFVPQAGLCQLTDFPSQANDGTQFEKPSDFADYLRKEFKVSAMAQNAIGKVRWAATFRAQPEFGLNTEAEVLNELKRRLIEAFG